MNEEIEYFQGPITNKILVFYERAGTRCESDLAARGYVDASIVAKRYRQYLCQNYNSQLSKKLIELGTNLDAIARVDNLVTAAGQRIDFTHGTVSGGLFWHRFSQFVIFCVRWLQVFFYIVTPTMGSIRVTQNDVPTIVTGLPDTLLFSDGSLKKFMDWRNSHQIDVLSNGDALFVDMRQAAFQGVNGNIHFSSAPLLTYLRRLDMTLAQRISLVGVHIRSFVRSIILFIAQKQIIGIAADFAFDGVLQALHRNGWQLQFLISNGDTFKQPLWQWRVAKTHVTQFDYSAAPVMLAHKFDPMPQMAMTECETYLMAPCRHLVWNALDGDTYRQLYGREQIEVVGIPEYLKVTPPEKSKQQKQTKRVIIFDNIAYDLSQRLDISHYVFEYTNAPNMINFVQAAADTVLEICNDSCQPVQIIVKRKRMGINVGENQDYPMFLENFANQHHDLSLAMDNIELNVLMEDADLVIAFPFTSAGYVAAHQGIDVIFYDIRNELLARKNNGPEFFESAPLLFKQRIKSLLKL